MLAVGKISMSYRSESAEKHFAQVIRGHGGNGRTDLELIREAMKRPENRYLARQVCWTLDILNTPTYVVYPHGEDYSLLIDALRPANESTIDVVVGELRGLASAEECNGLQLPRLVFETAYIFDKGELISELPKPDQMKEERFEAVAREIFDRAVQPNKGIGTDIARNHVFLFYTRTYTLAAQKIEQGYSLQSVDVQPSKLGGPHQLANVCIAFRNRATDLTEHYCCTVNYDGVFPYLAQPWTPVYGGSIQ